MKEIELFFDEARSFTLDNIKPLLGITGLYFIFTEGTEIQYPFGKSRLIYIGMSERLTNSLGNRLFDHYEGKSGNIGITSYKKAGNLFFTHLNYNALRSVWNHRVEDLESYFILDFVKRYGVYPICNNKSGFEILRLDISVTFKIQWDFFEMIKPIK